MLDGARLQRRHSSMEPVNGAINLELIGVGFRQRARKFDIVEGVCETGDLAERVNAEGDYVFVPVEKSAWGHTIAVPAK